MISLSSPFLVPYQPIQYQNKACANMPRLSFQGVFTDKVELQGRAGNLLRELQLGLNTEGIDEEARPRNVYKIPADGQLVRSLKIPPDQLPDGYHFYVKDSELLTKAKGGHRKGRYHLFYMQGLDPAYVLKFIPSKEDSLAYTLSLGKKEKNPFVIPNWMKLHICSAKAEIARQKEYGKPYIKLNSMRFNITPEEWEKRSGFFNELRINLDDTIKQTHPVKKVLSSEEVD